MGDEAQKRIPVRLGRDRAQRDRGPVIGEPGFERHLDGEVPFGEILERQPRQECVRRESVGVDHAPRRAGEMLVHRRENGADLRLAFGGHVCVPHVGVRRICHDMAAAARDHGQTEAALPAVGIRDHPRPLTRYRRPLPYGYGPNRLPKADASR